MAISKLKLFRITSNITDLDLILERFVNLEWVHPVEANKFVDQVHGLTSFESSNPCSRIYKEIKDLEKENDFEISPLEISTLNYSLDTMSDYVYTTHEKLQKYTQHRKETENLIKKYEDALTQIKNIDNEIPIIVQTAFTMSSEKEKSFKAGCDDYISKPINIKELYATVCKHIEKE